MTEPEALPRGTETLLIVDDQETVWDFLIEALQNLGYSVLLAENGEDAVAIYRDNPSQIDLVLLDMVMPRLGGHGTFYQIRAIDPDAKILLSSGFVQEGAVQDLLDNGAAGFIAKPHRLPKLTRAIRDVLDGKPVSGQI
jgi:CheY-like chemotaxis protein